MNRKKIVAGNWKMNTTLSEATQLILNLKQILNNNNAVEKIIFPPFTHITSILHLLNNTPNFYIGAQNCSEFIKGAYTGEISAHILQSVGCSYVLIGHSERRQFFNETNNQIIQKIKNAFNCNLKVIFCVGENLEQRTNNTYFEIVKQQITDVLSKLNLLELQNIILAYEPVWAIGTGETASPQQAQEMHAYLRTVIGNLFSQQIAQSISILYGGSCNTQNAKQLFNCPDIDGGLIGGASLNANDFNIIIQSF